MNIAKLQKVVESFERGEISSWYCIQSILELRDSEIISYHTSLLSDFTHIQKKIVEAVCKHFTILPESLLNHDKAKRLAIPRIIAYRLFYEQGHHPSGIARQFNNRTHSTILSGLVRYEALLFSCKQFRQDVERVRELGGNL